MKAAWPDPQAGPLQEATAPIFGKHRVLQDLSFRVSEGECLAVIGPNGSGKTVLFRALIGVIASEGRVTWAPGATIGYVPQNWTSSGICRSPVWTSCSSSRCFRRDPSARATRLHRLLGTTGSRR